MINMIFKSNRSEMKRHGDNDHRHKLRKPSTQDLIVMFYCSSYFICSKFKFLQQSFAVAPLVA